VRDVDIQIEGGVATLTMTPSGEHNTVGGTLLKDLLEAAGELERNDNVRAVVTAASGPIWCASAHFDDLERFLGPNDHHSVADDMLHNPEFAGHKGLPPTSEQARRFDRLGMGHWVLGWLRLQKPTIAALTGSVAGGGLALALMHDFRIASEDARFQTAFLSVGVGPEMALSWFLPRVVGLPAATDMLLRDRRLKAPEALQRNLVHEVAPAAEVVSRAEALAEELAAKAPLGVRAHVRALRASLGSPLRDQLELEWDNQRITLASDDARSAVQALKDGSVPKFLGR
jgi:2-(1,2-epoxy-1,2-dihydrophenyl)acetyl-CoA isomerase